MKSERRRKRVIKELRAKLGELQRGKLQKERREADNAQRRRVEMGIAA